MINKVGIISVQPRFSNSLLLKNRGNKIDLSEKSQNFNRDNSAVPEISDTVTFCGRITQNEILQGVLKNKIINSSEFAAIKQMRKNVIDAQSSCKKAIEQIKEVFGEKFMNIYFERSLKNTDDDILKDIIERRYFFDCNKNVVNYTNAFGNPEKIKNGFSITPYFAEFNSNNKINIVPDSSCKIYFDGDGKYLKVEGFSKEYEYINPEVVSKKTPRVTKIHYKSYNNTMFKLFEFGEKNRFTIYSDNIDKNKMLVLDYKPETKQVVAAFTEDIRTEEKIPVTNTAELPKLAEMSDFIRLSEKDYRTIIEGIIRRVLF